MVGVRICVDLAVFARTLVRPWGLPREQYEIALRWAEARSRAGVGNEADRSIVIALALYRLKRSSEALAMLVKNRDVPPIAFSRRCDDKGPPWCNFDCL